MALPLPHVVYGLSVRWTCEVNPTDSVCVVNSRRLVVAPLCAAAVQLIYGDGPGEVHFLQIYVPPSLSEPS